MTTYRTSMILPGDPNWMRGYTHYVNMDKPTVSTVGGGYDACYKCNGTGLMCDPTTLGTRTDRVATSYDHNGEGTLKIVETHSMGSTLYGLADGNKNVLIPPGEYYIYPTENGLVRYCTRHDKGSTTCALYAIGKGNIIEFGKWPGMKFSEDGRLIIAYNVETTYFLWDGERIREGRSVKEWQYKPNDTETYFYDKVAFDFGGKTLYGLAKGWDKWIFPPIYEDLELLGNRPESGVRLVFNGRAGSLVPPYGSFRYEPVEFENYSRLNSIYYKVEQDGKWAFYSQSTGEVTSEFKYDGIEYIHNSKRGIQPNVSIKATIGDETIYYNDLCEPAEKVETVILAEEGPFRLMKIEDQVHLYDRGNTVLETGPLSASTQLSVEASKMSACYVVTLTQNGNTTYGLFKGEGDKVYYSQGKYDQIKVSDRNTGAMVKKNGKWGVVDQYGDETIPPIYDDLRFRSSTQEIMVVKDGKWGIATSNGGEVIPLEYEDVDITDEHYLARKDGKWAVFYKKTGQQISKFEYDSYKRGYSTLHVLKGDTKYIVLDEKIKKSK